MSLRHVVAMFVALAATGAAPPPIAPISSRATYEVSLAKTSPGAVIAVRGRTVIEFRDTCTGWTTTQRFVADMTNAAGTVSRTDYITSTWESKDGHSMRFDITNTLNGQLVEHHQGTATLNADGTGNVVPAIGAAKGFALPAGTIFPTRHTLDILNAAREGETSLERDVFQGGDASGLYSTTATIGKEVPRAKLQDKSAHALGAVAWPVFIGYFPKSSSSETPEYEMSSQIYSNSVIGTMMLIYDRFTLKAKLTRVDRLAKSC